MRISLTRILALLVFVFVPASIPAFGANFNDGYFARVELERSNLDLVTKADFDTLEQLADNMRRKRLRFTDGGLQLSAFYSQSRKKTDEEWLQVIASLEAWNRRYPMSITARTALAWGWYEYAWFARGGGYANSVKEESWKLFGDRLARAYQLAMEPGDPDDCPARHELLLKLARCLGADDQTYDRIFQQAVTFDPTYDNYYFEKAENLLPRWGGEPGAWQRFAVDAMKAAPTGRGKIMYARIVSSIQQQIRFKNFKDTGISWPTLREGYQDIMRAYPGSRYNANRFAMFACMAKDYDTVRSLIGEDFRYEFRAWSEWSNTDIDACLKKSGLPSLQESALDSMKKAAAYLDKSACRQHLENAEKGNRDAMAQVAETYYRGGALGKDAVKAYAWLVLSGKRRELLDEITKGLSSEQQDQGRQEVERLKTLLKESN